MLKRRRAVRKAGAILALLALALQLVLAFGHMHPEDFFPAAAAHEAAGGAKGGDKSAPALPDDNCAICLNMAMIAATALPPPIVPVVPVAFTAFVFATPALVVPTPAPRRIYRSRDPPAV